MRVVVDTNVFISGFRNSGKPRIEIMTVSDFLVRLESGPPQRS
jgi:hypothetical protein